MQVNSFKATLCNNSTSDHVVAAYHKFNVSSSCLSPLNMTQQSSNLVVGPEKHWDSIV